jgi:hypothetical protein
VKIAVGIEHIATGGKFLTRGDENGRASTSPIRGTEQHAVDLCKEWINRGRGPA